ncbi:MAG: LEA type 2 family protein [Phycisphaerales bacterium]
MPNLPALATAALLAGGLAGCTSNPQVKAISAQRAGSTAEATEVRITLELTNPNDAPLELTTWDYSLIIDGRTAYTGSWVASLTLPAKDSIRTQIPAVVPSSFGDISGVAWFVGGNVGYRATRQIDRLLYQLGVNRLNAGFGSGATGVQEAPKPAPRPGPAPETAPAKPATPPAPAPR